MNKEELIEIIKDIESQNEDSALKDRILSNYARILTLDAIKDEIRRDVQVRIDKINAWEVTLIRSIRKDYKKIKQD